MRLGARNSAGRGMHMRERDTYLYVCVCVACVSMYRERVKLSETFQGRPRRHRFFFNFF
jgi:hypothetical protein